MKKKILAITSVSIMLLSSANAFAAVNNYSACGKYTAISLDNNKSNYLNGIKIKFDKNSCSNGSDISDLFDCYKDKYCSSFDCTVISPDCNNDSADCIGGSCESTEKPEDIQKPEDSQKPVDSQKPEDSQKPGDTVTDTTESAYAAEVVRLVNAERAKEGLTALKTDAVVQSAAQVRAKETVTSFSHTRPNGTSCFTALKEAGVSYRGAGENIAYGQRTPAEVVNAWMNSPGHRANIMDTKFTTIGVGCYKSGNTYYWSQFFTY
ncbi:MAG: CAP domain-containing protein [Clostridia bacterium]|nr:CAP domain-containing protein [Clostridia bacterium]